LTVGSGMGRGGIFPIRFRLFRTLIVVEWWGGAFGKPRLGEAGFGESDPGAPVFRGYQSVWAFLSTQQVHRRVGRFEGDATLFPNGVKDFL